MTEDWYFWSHRIDLARAAMRAGYRVTLAARFTSHQARIEAEGIRCVPVAFVRSMGNPLAELKLLFQLAHIIAREAPAIVHAVALKPMLLSALAIVRCPATQFCHAVTGLGYLFIAPRPAMRWLRARRRQGASPPAARPSILRLALRRLLRSLSSSSSASTADILVPGSAFSCSPHSASSGSRTFTG